MLLFDREVDETLKETNTGYISGNVSSFLSEEFNYSRYFHLADYFKSFLYKEVLCGEELLLQEKNNNLTKIQQWFVQYLTSSDKFLLLKERTQKEDLLGSIFVLLYAYYIASYPTALNKNESQVMFVQVFNHYKKGATFSAGELKTMDQSFNEKRQYLTKAFLENWIDKTYAVYDALKILLGQDQLNKKLEPFEWKALLLIIPYSEELLRLVNYYNDKQYIQNPLTKLELEEDVTYVVNIYDEHLEQENRLMLYGQILYKIHTYEKVRTDIIIVPFGKNIRKEIFFERGRITLEGIQALLTSPVINESASMINYINNGIMLLKLSNLYKSKIIFATHYIKVSENFPLEWKRSLTELKLQYNLSIDLFIDEKYKKFTEKFWFADEIKFSTFHFIN